MDAQAFKRWFDANFYAWATSTNSTKKQWLLSLLKFSEMEFAREAQKQEQR